MFTPRYNLFHHLGTNQIGRGHVDLLTTVLSIKFLQKGYSLVHSACVAKDGLGVLLIAPPDTGKTVTSLMLCKNHSFEFLNDDISIVGPKGILSFPTAMNIHPYILRSIRFPLRTTDRFKLTLQSLKIPYLDVRLELPVETFNDVRKRTFVKHFVIFFMEYGDALLTEMSRDEAVIRLMNLREFETPLYKSDLVLNYCYKFGINLFELEHLYKDIIVKNLVYPAEKIWLLKQKDPKNYATYILKALKH
jgi:hypothetical protein